MTYEVIDAPLSKGGVKSNLTVVPICVTLIMASALGTLVVVTGTDGIVPFALVP